MTEAQNETWETDGSPAAESASYKWRLGQALEDNRQLRSTLSAATVQLDAVMAEVRPSSGMYGLLRQLRITLTGRGLTGRERAEQVVEEWLKDPDRNVFGLAADLLDALPLRR